MNETLIAQVKRKLNITWEDDDTTARVNEIIESAIPDMRHLLGIPDSDITFDFATAGTENNLFKAYCLYEWNHCLNEFQLNYANEIAQAKAKWAVANYLADSEGSADAEK